MSAHTTSHPVDLALLDISATVGEYLHRSDWRVNANANQGYSLGGLILNIAGKVIANYWLNEVYTPEIGQAHRQADLHIHDLDMLSGYCAGWSLRTLLHEGLNGVPGKVEAGPPKHLSSAIGQMVNFLGTLQNEWAGAQAFSSFDTYLAPFIRKDNLDYATVRQCIQEFVYNLNVPSRWGTQTPFTNITFDWVCPDDLREQIPIIAGEEMPFSYGELQAEMDMINQAYIEVMTAGDSKGRVFTFLIPTYNITRDFNWESDNALRLFEMTARYGLFGSAEQTGSLGVVTVNCARLGYRYKGDKLALYARLSELMDLARDSLETKRQEIGRLMVEGLFPYIKRYLGTLRNHFSTIGVNGLNEIVRNFTDDQEDISTEQGRAFALELLDHVRERMKQYQEETGLLYLSDTRVPERRTRILPEMRRAAARRAVTVGHDRHFPKKQRRSSAWITRNFPMTANASAANGRCLAERGVRRFAVQPTRSKQMLNDQLGACPLSGEDRLRVCSTLRPLFETLGFRA